MGWVGRSPGRGRFVDNRMILIDPPSPVQILMRNRSIRGVRSTRVVSGIGPMEAVYRNVAQEVYVSCYWYEDDKRKADAFKLETIELV